MRTRLVRFDPEADGPDPDVVLGHRGLPPARVLSPRLRERLDAMREQYGLLARPRGLYEDVSAAEFAEVHAGEGANDSPAPLELVSARATHFALFAATVGEAVSERVSDLFARDEPLLGYLLDTLASEATDALATRLAGHFARDLEAAAPVPDRVVLPYSPGYCGWHLSGQRRLFARLRPDRIGVTLSGHDLMAPLKSVSGVLVAAPREAHRFRAGYAFCRTCRTPACLWRVPA